MSCFRVIFRLDYDPHYEMIDSLGKTMKIITSETFDGEKFLPDLLERQQGFGVAAQHKNPKTNETRILAIEPGAIHGSFDVVEGLDGSYLKEFKIYTKLIKIVNEARKAYEINMLNRSGVRSYFLDNVENIEVLSKFNSLIDYNFFTRVKDTLGEVTDSGIAFDGENADGIKYHLKLGPYNQKEADKYFPNTHKFMDSIEDYNVIADIDLYQNNFELDYRVSYDKWCSPNFERAYVMMQRYKQILQS